MPERIILVSVDPFGESMECPECGFVSEYKNPRLDDTYYCFDTGCDVFQFEPGEGEIDE